MREQPVGFFPPLLRFSRPRSDPKEHLIFPVRRLTLWSHSLLTCYTAKTFPVDIKVIPKRQWSRAALTKVDYLALPSIRARLDVDLEINPTLKGAFKTAHPGSVTPINGVLPSPLSGRVCVKQPYFCEAGGPVRRYELTEEQDYIRSEASCLDWARILLDLTYQWIEECTEDCGDFPGTILELRFVNAAAAEHGMDKIFLIEEWIDTHEAPFTKYINNARAVPCVPWNAPEEVQNIANFLCFAQHVQYDVTGTLMFTSDYQGTLQTVNIRISG